jgi:hypothetical protein
VVWCLYTPFAAAVALAVTNSPPWTIPETIVIGWQVPSLLPTRLTLGLIQLFDSQRVVAENRVGADIDGSTAHIDDQRIVTGL